MHLVLSQRLLSLGFDIIDYFITIQRFCTNFRILCAIPKCVPVISRMETIGRDTNQIWTFRVQACTSHNAPLSLCLFQGEDV